MIILRRIIYILLVTWAGLIAYVTIPHPILAWFLLPLYLFSLIDLHRQWSVQIISLLMMGTLVSFGIIICGTLINELYLSFAVFLLSILTSYLCVNFMGACSQLSVYMILALLLFRVSYHSDIVTDWPIINLVFIATLSLVLFHFIFLYRYSENLVQEWLLIALRQLKKLNFTIFDIITQANYPQNRYLFERRVHQTKIQLLKSILKLQDLIIQSKSHQLDFKIVLKHLNEVSQFILMCGQIRNHIQDPHELELCANELHDVFFALQHNISILMETIRKKSPQKNFYAMEEKIELLEVNYTNVLRVAARDPMNFLLLIANLKKLTMAFDELKSALNKSIDSGNRYA